MMKDIRLIALDLDGTLLDGEKRLSSRNRRAQECCIRHGIHIVPATGRPSAGIPGPIRALSGIRYGILTNGARVEDMVDHIVIGEEMIGWELAHEILSLLSRYPVAYDPYIDGRGKMEARFRDHLDQYGLPPVMQQLVRGTRDEVQDELAYVREKKRPVEKINVFVPDQKLRESLWERLKAYKELMVTSSLPYNLEVNIRSATKGMGLYKLAGYLGLGMEQTMAFGDGSNDVSMIQAAGIGVAMANGIDELKELADHITASNEEDGVAVAIEHFLGPLD